MFGRFFHRLEDAFATTAFAELGLDVSDANLKRRKGNPEKAKRKTGRRRSVPGVLSPARS